MAEGSETHTSPPTRVQYAGNGKQTGFIFPFMVLAEDDLAVFVGGQRQNAGYTIAGVGDGAGGIVSFLLPPANGALVTLMRQMAIRRRTDFADGSMFRPRALNDEFIGLTAAIQQVDEKAGRAIHASPVEIEAVSLELPGIDERRNGLLGFSADGSLVVTRTASPAQVDSLTSQAIAAQHGLASVPVVADVAALRAAVGWPGAVSWVAGHTWAGDGGEGFFRWVANSIRDDDGGVVMRPSGHTAPGCWHRGVDRDYSVRWWGAKGDGASDDTAALQAALDAVCNAGGGVLWFPAGKYKTTAPLTCSDNGALGMTLMADSAEILAHHGAATLVLDGAGTSAGHHHPYYVLRGLNIRNDSGGTAVAGLHLKNGNGTVLEHCYVIGFTDNYLFENTLNWSENIRMYACHSVSPINAHVRFHRSGTGSNSFARFDCHSFFIAGGAYGYQIGDGTVQCDVYDGRITGINGNFTGTAHVYIRSGGMEGTAIDGIYTEGACQGVVKLDAPASAKVPLLMNTGNYVGASVGTWIDGGGSAILPSSAWQHQFRLNSPLIAVGAHGTFLQWYPQYSAAWPVALLRTPAHRFASAFPAANADVTSTTPTMVTTPADKPLWPAAGGITGRLSLYWTASGGAGRGTVTVFVSAEGTGVAVSSPTTTRAVRSGYYCPVIDTVTVNPGGTVSFNVYKNSGSAPNAAIAYQVALEIM